MNFHPSIYVLSPLILRSEVRRLEWIKINFTEVVSYCTSEPTIRCTLTRLHSYQNVKSQSLLFIFNQTPCGPAAAVFAGFRHRLLRLFKLNPAKLSRRCSWCDAAAANYVSQRSDTNATQRTYTTQCHTMSRVMLIMWGTPLCAANTRTHNCHATLPTFEAAHDLV